MKKIFAFPKQNTASPQPAETVKGGEPSDLGMVDIPFLLLTVLLTMIGLIMVFSASYARAYAEKGDATAYFARQAVFALGGFAAMAVIAAVPGALGFMRRYSMIFLALSAFLLLLVLIFGMEEGGARRWIYLGFNFQPSEVTKLAVIISFAAMIATLGRKMETWLGVVPFGAILVVIAFLLWLEPHFSAIIIIVAIGGVMMFVGGMDIKALLVCVGLAAGAAAIYLFTQGYAMERITSSGDNIWADPDDTSYQIIQSLLAIGSGGLMGTGLGKGRQKYLYLPEEHNDYIFAIVCEELGFVGAVVILLLFALLIIRGFWIALHARDRFCTLLVAGIMTHIGLQVFFNIGVVTNFLPATGISLPLFSYGGTALLIQLAEMGIVLNASRWSRSKINPV